MLFILRITCGLILSLWMLNGNAWNMQGHQVVAQIAYDNLTPKARDMCHKYLYPRSKKSMNINFLSSSIWLDLIKFKNIHWYDTFHYIDIPFSTDGSILPSISTTNAVWGINHAVAVLSTNKTKPADKRLALLILIHLVGDIHQPLHAVSKVSHDLPKGDLGGNLFPLGANEVGNNLHKYWDNGAGFYVGKRGLSEIENKAQMLQEKFPCAQIKAAPNPALWAKNSHQLAVDQVYQIHAKEIPNKEYQLNAQHTVQQQSAAAGCQLAFLLNDIAEDYFE